MSQSAICSTSRLPAIRVLGTQVHAVQMHEALAILEKWVICRERGRYVIATGMHGIMEARRDPEFQTILNRADLFVLDGYSLVWLARRRGFPLPQRVCGSELLWEFCRLAAQRGYRVFFYGDTEQVLAQLTQRLTQTFPDLQIVGTFSPPFRQSTPEEDAHIVEMINATAPDVLWVGLGLPKQERWIVEHKDRLAVPCLVAVGAAFKLLSGAVKRAPRWMGEHGLEWIWRFAHEPRRLWRRTLFDVPQFTWLVFRELWGLTGPMRPQPFDLRHGLPGPPLTTAGAGWPWARSGFRPTGVNKGATGSARGAPRARVSKRLLDVILATLGLWLSWPVWAVIACLIKLEDGGTVIHMQERVGKGGRRFRSLKFRSMVQDADSTYGPLQARANDHRITRVGRLLRATALDELPQLWNILKGEMSFVRPRALLPGEIEVNGDGDFVLLEQIPGYEARHSVRPGLTGLAQVRAPRDIPRYQKFHYDLLYIRQQSLWLDLRLVAVSCWISLRGRWESRLKKKV